MADLNEKYFVWQAANGDISCTANRMPEEHKQLGEFNSCIAAMLFMEELEENDAETKKD